MTKARRAVARSAAIGVATAGLVASAGGGTVFAAQPRPLPGCAAVQGAGPGYNVSIGTRQDGDTVCITVGEKLLVVLAAPSPAASKWRSVHVSPTGILTPAPLTLALARGVTAANFLAAQRGDVALTSRRTACAPASQGPATCGAVVVWRVEVVVRTPQKIPSSAG